MICKRLIGQLENCVNHLDRAKRRYPTDEFDECIEPANAALYELSIPKHGCSGSAWVSVKDRLPDHGQVIVGMAGNTGMWLDVWDNDEPIGLMVYWCLLPDLPVMEGAGEGLDLSEDGEGL